MRIDAGSGGAHVVLPCRLAVQALGGSIIVEDRPGGGSAFVLRLR